MSDENKYLEIQDTALIKCNAEAESIIVPEGIRSIKECAFCDCEKLKEIVLPEGITNIHYSAFSGLKIRSITIPSTVKFIEERAFESCENLEEVIFLGDVLSIGSRAFAWCWKLERINLPDSIKTIHCGTFDQCYALKNFRIPLNVKKIESLAFEECTSLKTVEINTNVKFIGDGAFSNCKKLKTIIYNGTSSQWKQINNIHKAFEKIAIPEVQCSNGKNISAVEVIPKRNVKSSKTKDRKMSYSYSGLNSFNNSVIEKKSAMDMLYSGMKYVSESLEKEINRRKR